MHRRQTQMTPICAGCSAMGLFIAIVGSVNLEQRQLGEDLYLSPVGLKSGDQHLKTRLAGLAVS